MYFSLKIHLDQEEKKSSFIILLTFMIPLDFFYISEIWFIYSKIILEKKINKNERSITINSPNLLTNLSHVDYAVFSKTGTITTNKKTLSLLYSKDNGNIYEFDNYQNFLEEYFEKNILNKNFFQSFFTDTNKKRGLKEPKIFDQSNFIEHFCFSSDLENYHSLLEAFVICNCNTLTYSKKKKKNSFKFKAKDYELLFNLSKFFDYEHINSYQNKECTIYIIRMRKQIFEYMIYGFYEKETSKEFSLYSVVYRDPQINENILCCTGHLSDFLGSLLLSAKDKLIFDYIVGTFYKKGFIDPIIYVRRILNKNEFEEFMDIYRNSKNSLINQNDTLNELFSKLQFDLELIGIVGIEEEIKPDIKELIEFFKSLNIKSWILTGDSKINAYSVSHRISLFNQDATQHCIESENYEGLVKQTRATLVKINDLLRPLRSKKNNFIKLKTITPSLHHKSQENYLKTVVNENYDGYLLLNGKSFELILKDEYLYSNFLFITNVLTTVLGYNFSAENKRNLTNIIKNKFVRNPTVIAFGNGYNDMLMFNEADISIQMVLPQNFEKNMILGDLVSSNFKQIKGIMINYSSDFYDKYCRFIQFSYYRSFIFGFTLFIYSFYNEFHAENIYEPILSFIYYSFLNFFSQILCLLYYKKIPEKLRRDFQESFQEQIYQKNPKKIGKSLFLLILEALVINILINMITINAIRKLLDINGRPVYYNLIGAILTYSYSIFFHFKVNYFFKITK